MVKSIESEVTAAEQARSQLEGRFGQPAEWTIWSDGELPPERVEVFLKVLADTHQSRLLLGQSMESLESLSQRFDDNPSLWNRFASVFRGLSSGVGMVAELTSFIKVRDQALFENDMSLGEYCFIYSMSYGSLLNLYPESFSLDNLEISRSTQDGEMQIEISDSGKLDTPILAILEGSLKVSEEGSIWNQQLTTEIERLESDPERTLWEDHFPPQLREVLEPYRPQLENFWVPMTSNLELEMINNDTGQLGI